MCTYNGARFLREQLESIAAQTLLPEELVVCDDRSTDGTTTIIQAFAQSVRFPVRLFVNEQNLGPARNFEKAIAICRGKLIALSDQDDIWYQEKLSRLSRILDADATLGGVFSDARLMDEQSRQSEERLWNRVGYRPPRHCGHAEDALLEVLLKKHDVVTGATLLFRADLRDLFLPLPASWMHDGWIAWMLVLYSGIAAVDEPLIAYRVHASQHAGVSPRRGSLMDRIEHARGTGRAPWLPAAERFEDLRGRWTSRPGKDFDLRLRQIEQKIEHLRYRINLPGNFFSRLFRVCSAFALYHRYANGAASMCKDIFIY